MFSIIDLLYLKMLFLLSKKMYYLNHQKLYFPKAYEVFKKAGLLTYFKHLSPSHKNSGIR
jgi:hypothetical protein